ncbi:MAG: SDR family NAD(P)-dependent oxidoreductase [Alphaproteobacteria bacterium]|nr:SDR family NAD(P)-dependent oxidoreductase [Alphaproteobacteria bacterium]
MRAVVLYEHGDLDKLVFEPNYPDPKPGPGDVVLRMRACSLNYHDVFTRKGMPGIRLNFPLVVGIDLAGDIVEIGSEVEGWKIGDRVVIDPINRVEGGLTGETSDGGFAEFVRVRAHQLIRLDPAVSYAAAAALPTAYGTAYRMMIRRGKIAAGEKVLILGASGGVGTCCVQLAKQAGATVIACASSEEKMERLRQLGADHVINYVTEDFVKACQARYGKARVGHAKGRGAEAGGVDVVVNFTGGDTWARSLRTIRRDGRMLTCGATAGYDPPTDIRYIWTFELNIVGSNGWSKDDIEALLAMIKAGTMTPVIDKTFKIEEAREAMRRLDDRTVFGKVIVEP